MNTYKIVFQYTGTEVTIKADRFAGGDSRGQPVCFYTGSGECHECVGMFYLDFGDYIKLIDTESDDNCSCSKECSKDDD